MLSGANHFNTFSIKENNMQANAAKPEINAFNSTMVLPQMHLSSPNLNNSSMGLSNYSNISKFKNRKNQEKENRRMTLELVK